MKSATIIALALLAGVSGDRRRPDKGHRRHHSGEYRFSTKWRVCMFAGGGQLSRTTLTASDFLFSRRYRFTRSTDRTLFTRFERHEQDTVGLRCGRYTPFQDGGRVVGHESI